MIGNLLSPKMGLKMVKGLLQKQLGVKTKEYTIIYNALESTIDFMLPVNGKEKKFKYDDPETLCDTISLLVADKIENNDELQIAVIRYHDDEDCTAKIAFINSKGEKELITHIL